MSEVRQSFGFPLSTVTTSDVGRVRTNNEDAFGSAWMEDGSLFVIVCDGMGGHEAGEVASGLAVQVVEDSVCRDPDIDPRERLYAGLLEANAAILEEGRRSGTKGMGTTAISAVLKGSEVYVALIGDSRLYQIRKGQLVWRTLDHTRVQMLVDTGQISDEEARDHPEAGMLTRALGHARMADGRDLVPDVLAEPLHLQPLDALVMCSDGLHDLVEDWEVAQTTAGKTPEEASKALVALACERGGHDNVTVCVVIAGERTLPHDPHFVPETYAVSHDERHEDNPTFEMAFDGHRAAHGEAMPYEGHGAVPLAPASGGSNKLVIGLAVLVVMLLLGIILMFVVFTGAFVIFS